MTVGGKLARRGGAGKAAALATGLVSWSFVAPRIPERWRVPLQAGIGGLAMVLTRADPGLTPPRLWAGLRLGLPVAAVATASVAASTAVPAVRAAMATQRPPAPAAHWLALHIPLGTVWSEEAAFRAAIPTAAGRFRPPGARLVQAAAFGLSHIADARRTGEPVLPTVLVTGAAGWFFGWLAERSGSLAAPMLAHLAINEAGAAAVLAVRRRNRA